MIQNEFVQTIKPSVKHPVSHLSELYLKADNYKLVLGKPYEKLEWINIETRECCLCLSTDNHFSS